MKDHNKEIRSLTETVNNLYEGRKEKDSRGIMWNPNYVPPKPSGTGWPRPHIPRVTPPVIPPVAPPVVAPPPVIPPVVPPPNLLPIFLMYAIVFTIFAKRVADDPTAPENLPYDPADDRRPEHVDVPDNPELPKIFATDYE